MKESKTEIKVRISDTDLWGVVYFANYFRYFGVGIEEFFMSLGIPREELIKFFEEKKVAMPIVEASCQYKAPARFGDTLELDTTLKGIGNKKITFEFNLLRKYDGELIAKGRVTHVLVDENWKPIEIPKELRKLLEN